MTRAEDILKRKQTDVFYTDEQMQKDLLDDMIPRREELLKGLREYMDDQKRKTKSANEFIRGTEKKDWKS